MTRTIARLTASVALPAAAAIIGGAVIGLAGTASAADGAKGPIYSGPTGSASAPEKPFWNSKRDYYYNNKGNFYTK